MSVLSSDRSVCWYCSRHGGLTDEHVLSQANFGGRLVARDRVCGECNRKAGRIERTIASRPPLVEYVARFGSTWSASMRPKAKGSLDAGEQIMARWTPSGPVIDDRIPRRVLGEDGVERLEVTQGREDEIRERLRGRGEDIDVVGLPVGHRAHMQLRYGLGAETIIEWPRFGAKVALAIASLVLEEAWLESRGAKHLQRLFGSGEAPPRDFGIDTQLFPAETIAEEGPLACMRPGEHLLGLRPAEGKEGAVAWMILFGAIGYEMALVGAECPPQGPTWLLEPAGEPVRCQGIEAVTARLLKRGT